MTHWNRLVAVSLVLLMVGATVIFPEPAAAQEPVPTKPGVTLEPIQNLRQRAFLRFNNVTADIPESGVPPQSAPEPNCVAEDARKLRITAAVAPTQAGGRPACTFNAGVAGDPNVVVFTSATQPNRRVNFTGNDSFFYHHEGRIPSNVRVNIEVATGGTAIATGVLNGDDDATDFTVKLPLAGQSALTSGRVEMLENRDWTIRLSVLTIDTAPDPTLPGLPGSPPTWTLDDRNTYIEMRAENAIRAAMWITDERDVLRTVFAPIANESIRPEDRDRRVVAHFGLQSAFGIDDARLGGPATFSIILDGRPREITPNQSIITGVLNNSSSLESAGLAVWSFPTNMWNYRGWMSGEYTVLVEKNHHQGAPITKATSKTFLLTSQSVELSTFNDTRNAALREVSSHSTLPGASTTYLLSVKNTGAVNDTFTINVTAPNAPPGWGATIAGPDVQERRVFVPKGETRVFTVTVNAPNVPSGTAVHIVNATSTVDPGTRSQPLSLVTSISQELIREVGVFLLAPNLTLEPGVETHFPVYVWNRGTRTANISLEIKETGAKDWFADLQLGNLNVDRLVVSGIQPGGIGLATLKMTGPLAPGITSHPITLNVTSVDVGGVSSDTTLTFTLRTEAGVRVEILNSVGARDHVVEVVEEVVFTNPSDDTVIGYDPRCAESTPAASRLDCTEDGVEGIWFRIWVTNTGKVADTFRLSAAAFDEARCGNRRSEIFTPDARDGLGGEFGFYYRSPSGSPTGRDVIDNLLPGKTAEMYVYLPVDRYKDRCIDDDVGEDFFSFVVAARGQNTQAIGQAAARAVAANNGGLGGVHLEGVERSPDYGLTAPLVDISNANKRSIVGVVDPGKNFTYYVRMTNAASWAEYSEDGDRVAPDLRVHVENVDPGWNVSIRPVLDDNLNDVLRNPYVAEANLSNTAPNGRREAWFDRELEVIVQAPSIENGTALANLQDQISLVATTNHSSDRSTLEIRTIIGETADVSVTPDQRTVLAHPGKPAAFLLLVKNDGSAQAPVTLRAAMAENTPAAGGGWQVNPNAEVFPLPAFKNRTVALLVTPPAGASQGTTAEVNLTWEYPKGPGLPNATNTTRLTVQVVNPRSIQVIPPTTRDAVIAAGETATFTMKVKNGQGGSTQEWRALATPIPNWSVDVSPPVGSLNPGAERELTLVMTAPRDVFNTSSFATVVRVSDPQDAGNFDTAVFTVNIEGGTAVPNIQVPNLVKRVPRNGVQNFEVSISNLGNASGRIPLEVRTGNPAWAVGVVDQRGNNISAVTLGPNELVNVNVTVRAPFTVPERTAVPIEIIAYSPDQRRSARATLSAEIHDYGVSIALVPATRDGLPGVPTEFLVRLKNTGNENDTLNVSANLIDLPEWTVNLASQEARLEPNQEVEIRATIRSPTAPLPTTRAYSFPFWVGTRGGQAVNITKNMTVSAVVNIPSYRAHDVDRDGQLEVAVDLDKRTANGFEEFREIFPDQTITQVIAKPLMEGRTTYFLDIPSERPYDGVADVWFNPETVHTFAIEHLPDINGDGAPDYLIDTDRDGKIDKAFDSGTERFWDAVELRLYGDDRVQYLVDITSDGRLDRFYDPGTKKVTRTTDGGGLGKDFVGIDIDDDDRVDYYYNTRTKEASGAQVQNLGSFARDYWYFFVVFAALVILTVMLVVRRRRPKA